MVASEAFGRWFFLKPYTELVGSYLFFLPLESGSGMGKHVLDFKDLV